MIPELSLQLRYAEELPYARAAEEAGFARICVGDNVTDGFTMIGAFAATTHTAELQTSVTILSRTPVTTALSASTAAELSGGRFVLGLGTMPKNWAEDHHGIEYRKPVERMRDFVQAVRAAWTANIGAPVDYAGEFYAFRGYTPQGRRSEHRIPITLGVIRPKMTQLAAEIAEGVCIDSMHSIDYARAKLIPAIETGLETSGRSRQDFSIGAAVICAIGGTESEARDMARRTIGWYLVAPYLRDVLAHHGFSEAYDRGLAAFRSGGIDAAVKNIPDEVVESIALVGTPKQFAEKIQRYHGVFDWIRLSAPLGNPKDRFIDQTRRLVETVELMGQRERA